MEAFATLCLILAEWVESQIFPTEKNGPLSGVRYGFQQTICIVPLCTW